MPKLKIVFGKRLIQFLEKNGFIQTRQVGSHVVLVKGFATIVIPLHGGKDLGRGLIASILKEVDIDRETYEKDV